MASCGRSSATDAAGNTASGTFCVTVPNTLALCRTQGLRGFDVGQDRSDTATYASPFRFVWPSELDLMACIAGVVLTERWSDGDRQPFTEDSTSHVSVWRKVR